MYGTGKRGKKAERNNTKMSETYEIIVLDLDGTLTNSKKVIKCQYKSAIALQIQFVCQLYDAPGRTGAGSV